MSSTCNNLPAVTQSSFFRFSSLFAQSAISITRIVIARTSDTSHDHLGTKFTTVLANFRRSLLNLHLMYRKIFLQYIIYVTFQLNTKPGA